MAPSAQLSTLFPYTTLFRSDGEILQLGAVGGLLQHAVSPADRNKAGRLIGGYAAAVRRVSGMTSRINSSPVAATAPRPRRSEEHTSELQSHVNLVCRLLLEK